MHPQRRCGTATIHVIAAPILTYWISEDRRTLLMKGAAAGVLSSVLQAGIGKAEDLAFLPDREDSNIAPRLVRRIAESGGYQPSTAAAWLLGTAFHVGYGAFWGGVYAAAREHSVAPGPTAATGPAVIGGGTSTVPPVPPAQAETESLPESPPPSPLIPWVGGSVLGGVIWGITFPDWGGAVRTRTERPMRQRTWGMEVVALSVALGFGLCTAHLYERFR